MKFETSSVIGKSKDALKIAAFIFLIQLPLLAHSKEGAKDIESMKNSSREMELALIDSVRINGQQGEMGGVKIKRIIVNGKEITVGYDRDKEKWIMLQDKGGKTFLDNGLDGIPERFVLNKEPDKVGAAAFDQNSAFMPLDNLIKNAEVEADLDPQNTYVYNVGMSSKGEISVTSVDFSTGETSKLTGKEAEDYAKKIQYLFIGSMSSAIEKSE